MNSETKIQTFLYLSPNKIIIAIFDKKNFEKIFYKEILNNKNTNILDTKVLDNFLEKNIFEIEKNLGNFIEKIYLIIDSNEFLTINFSIKKNNYGEVTTKDKLAHILREAKDECKKTIDNRKIIHMLIDNYLLDKKNYSSLPINLKCNFIFLDVRFICLSNEYIKNIETILRKYQISINNILYSSYIKSFSQTNQENLFKMSMKIMKGYNENEVIIVSKQSRNKGFFERFFNFFN